jgi:hypothetical protein
MVGPDSQVEEEDALNHLVNAARPEVVGLLMTLFGDVTSAFLSLWKAGPDRVCTDVDDDQSEELTDCEIMNDATPEKCAAYCWLDSGASVILDPF